jgi:hypothetical protein
MDQKLELSRRKFLSNGTLGAIGAIGFLGSCASSEKKGSELNYPSC